MTSWDANPRFAPDETDGTATLWYRQMLIYAHELRALYAELRTTQTALSIANGRVNDITQIYSQLHTLLGDQFTDPIAIMKAFVTLVESADTHDPEVTQLAATLRDHSDFIKRKIADVLDADTITLNPRSSVMSPRTPPTSPHSAPGTTLAMLQAQNLSFARDMRVLYDAERERSAELRANNQRLNMLTQAGVRFGACKDVAELVSAALETAHALCEDCSIGLIIFRHKIARATLFDAEDVEMMVVRGDTVQQDWLAETQRAVQNNTLALIMPYANRHKMCIGIMSGDMLTGLVCVDGDTHALLDTQSSLLTLTGLISVTLDNIQLYADLSTKQATLNRFVSRLLSAQETERRRVAIDLHDGLAQTISSASHFFEAARHAKPILDSDLNFNTGTRILRDATTEARRLMADLRPSTLDELGLVPTLRGLVGQVAVEEGWMAEFETFGHLTDLNNHEVEDNLFRITQEALTNIKKHAATTRVLVRVQREDDTIHVAVRDWGIGMDVDAVAHAAQTQQDAAHMGLVGIAERTRLLGGQFSVDSKLGEGTLLRVSLPLAKD